MAGVEWVAPDPLDQVIPGVRVVAKTRASLPSPRIIPDEDWVEWEDQRFTVGQLEGFLPDFVPQMRFKLGPSGYVPSRLNADVVPTQMTEFARVEEHRLTHDVAEAACAMVVDYLRQHDCEFDFCTEEEAWNGFTKGDLVLEPLPLETSPGFLFAELLPKGRRSKRDLLLANPNLVFDVLQKDWESLEGCTPMIWPFKMSLKVELRDWERVLQKKTRLYDGGPLPYTFAARRLYGDFMARMYRAAKSLKFASCAGMDVFRGKWNLFVQYMAHGGKGILDASDIAKWDKNMLFMFFDMYAQILTALCKNPESWRIGVHEERVAQSPIFLAALGLLFYPSCSQHSGRADTIISNTVIQLLVMFITWCENTPRELWNVKSFFEHIHPRMMGDDNLTKYMDKSPVQAHHVREGFARFGWLTTSEGTGGPPDVAFAGRTSIWVPIANQWWPVLPRGRVIAIMEWIKRGRGEQQCIERWQAGAVYAFPFMFAAEPDPIFHVIWEGLKRKQSQLISNGGAHGVSMLLSALFELYSGFRMSEGLATRLYNDYVYSCRAAQRR